MAMAPRSMPVDRRAVLASMEQHGFAMDLWQDRFWDLTMKLDHNTMQWLDTAIARDANLKEIMLAVNYGRAEPIATKDIRALLRWAKTGRAQSPIATTDGGEPTAKVRRLWPAGALSKGGGVVTGSM